MAMARRQTLVQLSDELVSLLDQRVSRSGRSRSELIREALELYLREDRESGIDRAIVEGYTRMPQKDDPWVEILARESIRAEPW
jgi:metal-responsive CopG/Arc/MetJ family transcriptional regulator